MGEREHNGVVVRLSFDNHAVMVGTALKKFSYCQQKYLSRLVIHTQDRGLEQE